MKSLVRFGTLLFVLFAPVAVAAPDDIRIYEAGMLTRDRYEVVGRLWVDSWQSAFQVPTHAARSEAIAALQHEASQRGANALTNVACLVNDAPLPWSRPHFCYALAIRVR